MMIAKEDIQRLMAADIGALPLVHDGAVVFNLKSGQFTRQTIHDVLHPQDADDVVCLCDPGIQPGSRPYPQPVDMSRFRKLNQDELKKGFHFNNLTFESDCSGGMLTIFYKNEPVYEEPVYLQLHCDDDEPDEQLEASAFFENRMNTLHAALKTVYGKTARLECRTGYPVIRVTQDIADWLNDQIEDSFDDHRDNLLAALKLLLQAGDASALDNFIGMVSDPVDDVDAVVDALFPEYINFCDISAGYRTALWDGMVAVYQYFSPNMEYDALIERIQKRFEQDEFREFKEYDIAITSAASTMILLNHILRDPTIACRRELAIAMLCFALKYGMF